MARVKLLADTDVFIDYLNFGFLGAIFESRKNQIHYSVITKKELLSKKGLKESERRAILLTLKNHRLIPLDRRVAESYSQLRNRYPLLEKEDALVAASALVWNLPLLTRNWKHYRNIREIILYSGEG